MTQTDLASICYKIAKYWPDRHLITSLSICNTDVIVGWDDCVFKLTVGDNDYIKVGLIYPKSSKDLEPYNLPYCTHRLIENILNNKEL